MFRLQEDPIDAEEARKMRTDTADGALVAFEGIVRADEAQGHVVNELLYIADKEACLAEGDKIMAEALAAFPISGAVCIQRVGQLKAGETAVWIGVWAGHRDEAFNACRYIIEEVKKRLLIWKKEFYCDGSKAWLR